MRSDQQLLELVHRRAAVMRRRRRACGGIALCSVAAVVAGLVALQDGGGRSEILTAGPGADHAEVSGAEPGEVLGVGRLEIPAIGLDAAVVEGVSIDELAQGVGRFPETAAIGEAGNTSFAGYRDSFGAPFARLDELRPGDRIIVRTSGSELTYEVREAIIVVPSAVEVLEPTFWTDRWGGGSATTLTLTTEHPTGGAGASHRLVVGAEQVDGPTGAPSGDP